MPRRYIQKQFIERILQLKDTPESIARGAALGALLGMTPTVGIQMILIVIINTICRANRVAGVVMVYISNPFTLIPIYWADYLVGTTILGMERITRARFNETMADFVAAMKSFEFGHAFHVMWSFNWQLGLPMLIGGLVLGIALAVILYPIILRGTRIHQHRRARREALLELRDVRRRERAEQAKKSTEGGGANTAPEGEAKPPDAEKTERPMVYEKERQAG